MSKISNIKYQISNFLKHPLLSGSLLMIGGSMAANFVNYIYHLVIGRLLGPADYGVLASIFSILSLISIVPISTSFAIVKFISEAKDEKERQAVYGSIKNFVFKIAIIGCVVIIILTPLISNFLHITDMVSVIFTGPIFFLSLLILVEQAAMQGMLRFIGVVGPNFASSLFKFILGVAFVILGFSVPGAIVGMFIGLIATYYLTIMLRGNLFKNKSGDHFELSRFLKYSFPVLMQALAFTTIFTVDVILAKHFLPSFEAGIYAAISTLGKIIFFATQPVTATMFPIISGRHARGEKYKKVFITSFLATFFVVAGIVGIYFLFPGLAIGVLYGSRYLSATYDLVWMGLFIGVYSLNYLMVNFLLSIDREKIVVLPVLSAFVQTIGIFYWHETIRQIIQVSLISTLFLFASLVVYLWKQWVKRGYSLS